MSTVVINSDAALENKNELLFKVISLEIDENKEHYHLHAELLHIKEAIKRFEETGIDIRLSLKYDSHRA